MTLISHSADECQKYAWFDRTICPEPCGDMHYYCGRCGRRIDPCPHDRANDEPHPCSSCGKPLIRPASDECVNPDHRSTDHTLGLREAGCGCCVVVDRVALDLLRARPRAE